MSSPSPHRPDARPVADAAEADAAEQAIPVGPDADGDSFSESDAPLGQLPLEADPADAWEQSQVVSDPDEDYDHDR